MTHWIRITGAIALLAANAIGGELHATRVKSDVAKTALEETSWKGVKEEIVPLVAQPMALPRPKTTQTSKLRVQVIHDDTWIAFRLRWRADRPSEAGRLAEFSDAVAMEFPVKDGPPPPVFMGMKDNPVHIFHWRAQYQRDQDRGKPEMKDLYPNMNPDMYPMEFKDAVASSGLTDANREQYSPGRAAGNPQSYEKTSAVDEIVAEGYGSSSVIQDPNSSGRGSWSKGEWSVVIVRPLVHEGGSTLALGKPGYVGFAVWQGAKQEVGARKSVTMSWVPLALTASTKGK